MQIIPSIDIIHGKCVRLSEGRFETRKEYDVDASEMARRFALAGARFLHVVDLEGAQSGHFANWSSIEEMGTVEGLRIQVGGGVRSFEDVERLIALGVERVVVGSLALRSPQKLKRWAERLGPEKFCIAIDLKNGEIAYAGWQRSAPVRLETLVPGLLEHGFRSFLSTDVERDGMMKGPYLELYGDLVRAFPEAQWLASGGVNSLGNLQMLMKTGVHGAIIGKAFYEGTMSYEECVRSVC